jgi:hypothetical protein
MIKLVVERLNDTKIPDDRHFKHNKDQSPCLSIQSDDLGTKTFVFGIESTI